MQEKVNRLKEEIRNTPKEQLREERRKEYPVQEDLTVGALKQTRSDVGQKIKSFYDPVISRGDSANLKKLYGALSSDLHNSVKVLSPEYKEAYVAAEGYYKNGMKMLNSPISTKINTSDAPEKLIYQIIKPGEVSGVQTLKQITDKNTFESVKSIFQADILRKSIGLNGGVDAVKFVSNLNKWGDTIKEMFTPQEVSKLMEVKQQSVMNDIIKKSIVGGNITKNALENQIKKWGENNLKSILTEQQLAAIQDARTLLSSLPEDNAKTKVIELLKTVALFPFKSTQNIIKHVLGEVGLNALINSKWGRKYVTEGFPKPLYEAGTQALSKTMKLPILRRTPQAIGTSIFSGNTEE